jgi:hypothetical protein
MDRATALEHPGVWTCDFRGNWYVVCSKPRVITDRGKIVLALVWLIAAVTGIWLLQRFESTPGVSKLTPNQWPANTAIKRPGNQPVLVMFAHPKCPCTRASIDELNRLLARCKDRIRVDVLFFQPSGLPENWSHGTSWEKAASIPGVTAHADPDGAQARLFGAETSGYVVVYDPRGHLLFRGGITAGRGHAGDNPGADAIAAGLLGHNALVKETPVFGCDLLDRCEPSVN